MKLKIFGIIERGVWTQERLQLSVLADANLNYYAIFDTMYVGDGISSKPKNVYWFTNYWVKAGDIVVLYTGPGVFSTNKRPDGGTNHFFYWGRSATLWNNPSGCAVLLEVNTWETSPRVLG
jgi:hypothetical protein